MKHPPRQFSQTAAQDPANPAGTVVSDANRAPLWTVVSPWGKGTEWNAADWTHSSVSADGVTTYKWRPHELDFRKFTDDGDPATPILQNVVPPYLPPCETTLVSAPGSDGLWGALTAFDVKQRDADAKDNLYSNQRDE